MSVTAEVIVLRDEVRLEAILAFADADGWILREQTSRAHLVLASRRWSASVGEEITYVADHPGGCHSLRVTGTSAGPLTTRLREQFPHHSEQELLDVVLGSDRPDGVACVRVASKLAACRPDACETRHLAALERLLGHPVTAVRRAGIRSAYTCGWPELLAVVEARQKQEQHLRAQLEHLTRYLKDGGSSS